MTLRPQALFAEQKKPEKRRFEEKRKDAFHRQRLPDDSPGGAGKLGPVGAELEFHRDACDHTQDKVNTEDPRPEARSTVVMFAARAQGQRLQDNQKQCEPHGKLREDIVERNREGKMKPMNGK